MHKMSFEKLVSLISHLKPNELVHPLVEHFSFIQSQFLYMQAQQAMSEAKIEILEREIAELKSFLVPQGLGGK